MASFKPAYLIHGDDHGRVGERRARLRAVAEAEGGGGGVELIEGDAATPEAVANALCAMTFATGRRFIIVDGVERWKDADVTAHLVSVLASPDPDTTVAFFAREEKRYTVPAALVAAVTAAGGDVAQERALEAKELPAWVLGEARRLGLELDPEAARVLVSHVGDRQQRLLRELERLALEHGAGTALDAAAVEDAVADGSEKAVWGLGDAVVAGNSARITREWLGLRDRGETPARLVSLMLRRVREVHAIAARMDAGEGGAEIKASMKGNPFALGKRIDEARRADADQLGRALELLVALERDTRGDSKLEPDTLALLAFGAVAA